MKTSKIIFTLAAATAVGLMAPAGAIAVSHSGQLQENVEQSEPFKGKVEAVDIKAKTLTVAGAVILVSDSTKLTKKGNSIELKDIKAGDHVRGKTRKNADGKTEAINVAVLGENE